MIQSPSRTQWK